MISNTGIQSGIHAVVVPHTHWDREWYRPFQEFRLRLVQTVDCVLDLLDQDLYPYFLLDGQTVVLDDYLQIRPEQEERVRRLIKGGRLGVGPWFVLMDEFLVSGESLIRNLLAGKRALERFEAPPPRVGYLPDMFGHIAQMPQILARFGLDRAVLWRGVDPAEEHFHWQGPDGTTVATVFLPEGYHNVILSEERRRFDERVQMVNDFFAKHRSRNIFFPCGSDHLMPRAEVANIVRNIQNQLAAGHVLRLGSLNEAVTLIAPEITVAGELRYPSKAYILPDVASTRLYLKQWNARCQTLLERYAEPLAALAWLADHPYPREFLREAWRLLLLNHPHDSISGCGVDEVHRENVARYEQVAQLGEGLVKRFVRQLSPRSDVPGLFLYNPTGWTRTEWVRVDVHWPRDRAPDTLHFVNEQGQALPMYLVDKEDTEIYVGESEKVPDWYPVRRFGAILQAQELPPHGYTTVKAVPGLPAKKEEEALREAREEAKELQQVLELMSKGGLKGTKKYQEIQVQHGELETRILKATLPQVSVDETGIENELVHLGRDGDCLVLFDKVSGHVAPDVHFFLDGGDAGDQYNWSPPEGDDKEVRSRILRTKALLQTPALCRWQVDFELNLPAGLSPDRKIRVGKPPPLQITSVFTLAANSRRIEVHTELTNAHTDHRLRLMVGTGLGGNPFVWADTTFAVIRRKPTTARDRTPLPVAKLKEYQATTYPQQSFTAAEGDTEGIAVLVRGLPEAEVLQHEKHWAIAVTLLRAVGWLSRGDLRTRGGEAGPHFQTPDAQCLGAQRYDYAIVSYTGNWLSAGLVAEAMHFNAPLRAQEFGGWLDFLSGGQGGTREWLRLSDPRLVISAVKLGDSADVLVLRIVNPTPETIEATVTLTGPFGKVHVADLREQTSGKDLKNPWTHTWNPYTIETFVIQRQSP